MNKKPKDMTFGEIELEIENLKSVTEKIMERSMRRLQLEHEIAKRLKEDHV